MPVEHPDPLAFKAWLRSEALAAGFALAGFAPCDPFPGGGRPAPGLVPGGARHPAALLGPGHPPGPPVPLAPGPDRPCGLLPLRPARRGSRGRPWQPQAEPLPLGSGLPHDPQAPPTRLLEAAQVRWPGLEGRVCVDTAPLLERQLAARAGLGWQGKHTLLIAGKDGSWGFLGVLLLSVELPPDEPMPTEHCGTCTACLEACPSGALEPFRLDPARCLTTYTIETEAEPPPTSPPPWPPAAGRRAAMPARRPAPGTGPRSGVIRRSGAAPARSTPARRRIFPGARPSGGSSPGGPP